jgi:uncharacterized membrane protein
MLTLIAGLLLFFSAHSVSIVNDAWRNRVAQRIGEKAWMGIYSLISIAGFVLIVWGYGLARQEPVLIYIPPDWLRHLAMLLLLFVFPLLIATYFPGRISRATRHPMLAATKIWAFSHLLVNGMLHDLLLFGAFLAWAVADRISMKRREQRPLPGAPSSRLNDVVAIVGGVLLYLAFVFVLHRWLIGVPVMP